MAGKFLCEYCGMKYTNMATLAMGNCIRHPNGTNKGKHKLYEGGEKMQYMCKYCGKIYTSLETLTFQKCLHHPSGAHKGFHSPAL